MKKVKITQEKAAFYVLWKAWRKNPEDFVPTWKFVGELEVEELNDWFFMSYKCPTNGLTIFFKNPNLIERRLTTGKTGTTFYEYRIAPNLTISRIVEPKLLEFYQAISKKQV